MGENTVLQLIILKENLYYSSECSVIDFQCFW